MIFEFFKKLFWRADESSRKRKNCEWHENEAGNFSKKTCKNVPTGELLNNNEFVTTELGKDKLQFKSSCFSSLNSSNCEKTSGRKFEILETPIQWSSLAKKKISQKNDNLCDKGFQSPRHSYTSTNFTLYKTCQLIDRQKYSHMLLNFVNPSAESFQQNQKHNDDSNKVAFSDEHSKFVLLNHSIEHVFDRRNVSNNGSHYYNQDFQENRQMNCVIENEKFQYSHKIDHSSFDLDTYPSSKSFCKTNSLKEKFSTKDVMKQSFITQLTEKYKTSLEQRNKEAEEIKKMTHVLAKHNRLVREAALEDHLNRSMRLCEVIVDEKESLELKLPQLDTNMMKRIESALSLGPANEILVQEFGLRITRKDIQTLAGLNWLNDEVINFYMNLLIKRGNCEKYPSVYAMNTFFYPKLVSGGHVSLKRWTRKIDIFSKDLIVVPVHLGIHWCMSIIDFRNKTVQYYDSMGSLNHKCLQVLKQYLQDESLDKKKKSFEFIGWSFECIKDIPQQMNGSDCGVFSCMFAEYICANKKLDFSQEDMPYFRKKMVYEILTIQLL